VWASKGYGVGNQYGNEFMMRDMHFITENPWKNNIAETDITFKIRHTPEFTKGKLIQIPQGYFVKSESMLQGIAPGQFGVIYDKYSRVCFGSGEISINRFI